MLLRDQDPLGPQAGALTDAGFARVDVVRGGRGRRLAWVNTTEAAPSVVPKLSTRTGLIYTCTQDPAPSGTDRVWSWTAISFRTGRTVFKQAAGTGPLFNNNYAGITIGPNRSLYLGTFGGIVALRDGR